tara:strand:- start:76 stop:783 length:708 start_codon:yes stop_codon:yes gene_type:complete
MALPKLEHSTYELDLPSTGEQIKFRPFLVKEQKHLMIAMESEKSGMLKDTLAELISNCTFKTVDPYKLPMFDIEYLFLQIRSKSVGETVELNLICPDDEKTPVKSKVKLSDVNVHMGLEHTNEINVTDTIKIVMRYPNLNDYVSVDTDLSEIETVFKMMRLCVDQIHEGDKIHQKIDISNEELDEFIDSLPAEVIDKMAEFFDTMPKLQHVIKVTNPKTKKKGEVKVEGLQSFFV